MITLSGIEKSFGSQKVLHDISLTLPEGSVTALIGPSGSGKSTLLRCVNLLEIPQAGTVKIGSEDISFNGHAKPKKKDIRRICQQTGMVFQNFQLFPHLTVLDNIMRGLVVVQKWPVAKAKARGGRVAHQSGHAAQAHAAASHALRRPAAARGDCPCTGSVAESLALR
jgi:cystine transport system ATP-binding protein